MKKYSQVFKGVTSMESGRNSRMEKHVHKSSERSPRTSSEWTRALGDRKIRLSELSTEHLGYWVDANAEGLADTQLEAEWLSESEDRIFKPEQEKIIAIVQGAIKAGASPTEIPTQFHQVFAESVQHMAYEMPEAEIIRLGESFLTWVEHFGDQDAIDEVRDVLGVLVEKDDVELELVPEVEIREKDQQMANELKEELPVNDDVTQESGEWPTLHDMYIENLPTAVDGEEVLAQHLYQRNIDSAAFELVAKNPREFGLPLPRLKKREFIQESQLLEDLKYSLHTLENQLGTELHDLPWWKRGIPGLFSASYREKRAQFGALLVQYRIEQRKMDKYQEAFKRAEAFLREERGGAEYIEKNKMQG